MQGFSRGYVQSNGLFQGPHGGSLWGTVCHGNRQVSRTFLGRFWLGYWISGSCLFAEDRTRNRTKDAEGGYGR